MVQSSKIHVLVLTIHLQLDDISDSKACELANASFSACSRMWPFSLHNPLLNPFTISFANCMSMSSSLSDQKPVPYTHQKAFSASYHVIAFVHLWQLYIKLQWILETVCPCTSIRDTSCFLKCCPALHHYLFMLTYMLNPITCTPFIINHSKHRHRHTETHTHIHNESYIL